MHLEGTLQRPWVQAKDIILELLRQLSASGGKNKIFEFTGPGTHDLSVPERGTNSSTRRSAQASRRSRRDAASPISDASQFNTRSVMARARPPR